MIIMAVLLETSCVERGFIEIWALPQAVHSERMEEADVRVGQLDLLSWLGQVYWDGWGGKAGECQDASS